GRGVVHVGAPAGANAAVECCTRADCRTAGFAAAAAPTGDPGRGVVHVGAPAGANAAVAFCTCTDCCTAGFAAAAAPTGDPGRGVVHVGAPAGANAADQDRPASSPSSRPPAGEA